MRPTVIPLRIALTGLVMLLLAPAAFAAGADSTTSIVRSFPMLLGKSWAIGYVIFALAVLLGTLAVLIPPMRKAVRKRSN